MIEISGPKNPTYSIKLEFDNLTLGDIHELWIALSDTGRWSDEEYDILDNFLTRESR